MNRWMVMTLAGALGLAPAMMGQAAKAPDAGTQGRGRGGAPMAMCDTDKDGKCDRTGRPVGESRMQGQDCCRGRMMAGRMGRGRGGMMGRAGTIARGGMTPRGGMMRMRGGMAPGMGRGFAARPADPPAAK